MHRYLVRPHATLSSRGLPRVGRRLHRDARREQIDAVIEARRLDPFYDELRRWMEQLEPGKARPLCGLEAHHTPVTGTKIVEMEEEHAQRLRDEVPHAHVVRDRPLELIRPEKVTASEKEGVEGSDPWHLEAIGLAPSSGGERKGGEGVTVVVLDTGVDASHPELAGRIHSAFTFDVDAWKANPQDPCTDTQGHGTHVTGLLCGKTVGVAPRAQAVNGVMIPGGIGKLSEFIFAMEWAGNQAHVQVVNCSAGLPGFHAEMETAVSGLLSVGVLPVMAIGNEGRGQTRSPGNYSDVVSVGASTKDEKVASFSGGGTVNADGHQYPVPHLVAPGEKIYSCIMGGGYQAWNGTSMATPIVSGIAALILEREPHIAVTDLSEEILAACHSLGMPADRQGAGLARVPKA